MFFDRIHWNLQKIQEEIEKVLLVFLWLIDFVGFKETQFVFINIENIWNILV